MNDKKVNKYLNLLLETTILLNKTTKMSYSVLPEKLLKCPCSTKYHGAYPGGLLDHLSNVYSVIRNLYFSPIFEPVLDEHVTVEQASFCALAHDLGKLGTVEQDFYLINPDESKRENVPYIVNTELVSIPHEIRTLYWLDQLNIRGLSQEEYQAICFHGGPYTPGYLDNVRKETPLLTLLHAADNLSTKLLES